MIGALSLQGLDAVMTVAGATDGDVFRAYVRQVLRPTLVAGAVVIMENLGAHKVPGSRAAMEARGAQGRYVPPYAPDLSPIAPCWSKVTTALRTVKARAREALEQALAHAMATITAGDARNWFIHCGYPIH